MCIRDSIRTDLPIPCSPKGSGLKLLVPFDSPALALPFFWESQVRKMSHPNFLWDNDRWLPLRCGWAPGGATFYHCKAIFGTQKLSQLVMSNKTKALYHILTNKNPIKTKRKSHETTTMRCLNVRVPLFSSLLLPILAQTTSPTRPVEKSNRDEDSHMTPSKDNEVDD